MCVVNRYIHLSIEPSHRCRGLGEACEGRREASRGWRHKALPGPTIGALGRVKRIPSPV